MWRRKGQRTKWRDREGTDKGLGRGSRKQKRGWGGGTRRGWGKGGRVQRWWWEGEAQRAEKGGRGGRIEQTEAGWIKKEQRKEGREG